MRESRHTEGWCKDNIECLEECAPLSAVDLDKVEAVEPGMGADGLAGARLATAQDCVEEAHIGLVGDGEVRQERAFVGDLRPSGGEVSVQLFPPSVAQEE